MIIKRTNSHMFKSLALNVLALSIRKSECEKEIERMMRITDRISNKMTKRVTKGI